MDMYMSGRRFMSVIARGRFSIFNGMSVYIIRISIAYDLDSQAGGCFYVWKDDHEFEEKKNQFQSLLFTLPRKVNDTDTHTSRKSLQ